MQRVDNIIDQIVIQLQHWNGSHSLYGFAAVLVVYIFTVFGRGEGG
ncbi:MAG: hypothetical protein AB7F89_00135 [Pirellulaceae bacterium]